MESGAPKPAAPATYNVSPASIQRLQLQVLPAQAVLANMASGKALTIDARSKERFAGSVPVSGAVRDGGGVERMVMGGDVVVVVV